MSNHQTNPTCSTILCPEINSEDLLFTGKQYAIVTGHRIAVGQQWNEKFSGRCVHRLTRQTIPVAVIELTNSQDVSLPTGDEHDSLHNMEGWKDERAFILRQYTTITNKNHELHHVGAVISDTPVVHCGSSVMSAPRDGETIFGTFIGCLKQKSGDGAEVEWYIVFPFKWVLDYLKTTDLFRGKTLRVLSVGNHGLATPDTFRCDAPPSCVGSS